MTNGELNYIVFALNSPAVSDIKSTKVNYAIEKNKQLLKNEMKVVQALVEKTDGYADYKKAIDDLNIEREKSTDKGSFDVEYKKLDIKFKSVVDAINDIYNQENTGFNFFSIKSSDLPDNLSNENMKVIFPFIVD
jgi:hypothetical protein